MKKRRRAALPNPYHELLRELNRAGVEYIVIGVSGINYFAKDARQILSTADYDLFLKPTPENVARAWKAFRKRDYAVAVRAGNRTRILRRVKPAAGRRLVEGRRTLVALGPYQLIVEGLLEVSGFTFDEMKRRAIWMKDRELRFRFLVGHLEDLLESKRQANRDKDRLFLARYRRLLLEEKGSARLFLLAFVCAAALFAGCARNYVSKRRQFKLISEKTEIEIGRKAKADIIKEYGSVKDLEWQIYLDRIGQRLAKASDRPNLPYDFTILDSDQINAFAVPGGFVFVTRGILQEMVDEAELAVVLGHEITHVAAWHGVEMLQRAGLLSTLTALGAVGGIALGAGEAAIALAQAAGVYENLYLLGYGRRNELEADRHGVSYAARAGYDPGAALTFFHRLDKIEKEEQAGQNRSPYWQTHPSTADRLARAAKWIAQVEPPEGGQPAAAYNRDPYLAMVQRLPHGEPAERGIIEGQAYVNSVFGLRLEAPSGWKLDNSRAATVVTFSGPAAGVQGSLVRHKLPQEMGVQDFAKRMAKQWGIRDASVRETEYPAGHGMVWQYGGDYMRYRTLLIVRGAVGYALTCQMPADAYLQHIVDCEKIMRSFEIQ